VRIFLTGATGHVGASVLSALRRAGHSVVALVRSPARAEAIATAGVTPIVGDLADPDVYAGAAGSCDAIVHTAFEYGPAGEEDRERDERAVVALLASASPHLVYTSNAYLLDTTGREPVDETVDVATVGRPGGTWRFALERRVLEAPIPAAIVRPGMVYGGQRGTVADLFAARGSPIEAGPVRASVVYHHDLAELYRLVVERRATGIFHGVDGQPLPASELVRLVTEAGAGDPPGGRPAPHTLDVLHRDLAVTSPRSFHLGWRPRFPSFRDGAPTARAEWLHLHDEYGAR